ncbi:hypothetical protein ACIQ9Q_28210 [Streptomyces sp. NPDC094438]|uniref:hypothetical protein n=1 Tax=Streptomyces sp. NPDC094438 TaxID=3366061 RepID=UPI00380D5CC5
MSDQETAPAAPADDVAELSALIADGGFWRLAPDWVPCTFAPPTSETLRAAEAGLRAKL